jgi:porin-like protein
MGLAWRRSRYPFAGKAILQYHNIRMRLTIALLLVLLAPISSGWAQLSDTKALGKKSDAPVARPKDRTSGMKACPEYGAGFYRLEGSNTCIRIGGGIGTDAGTPGMRR